MLYYRVVVPEKVFRFNGYMQTVKNELFTPAEFKKYSKPDKTNCYLKPEYVKPVNVKKNCVYWFFGARFEFGAGFDRL